MACKCNGKCKNKNQCCVIEHGMIGFVSTNKSNSILTRAIKFFERSMWNHVFLVIELNGKLMAFEEGTLWGITVSPLDDYLIAEEEGKYTLAFAKLKNIPGAKIQKDKNKMTDFCLSMVGKEPYGFWHLFLQIPRQILQNIGVDWKYKARGYVCSTLVAYVLNKFYGVFKNWESLSPDDIHESDEIIFINR